MPEPLKNIYNQRFFDALCTAFTEVYPDFDTAAFRMQIFDTAWEARELKARIRHITLTLQKMLPADYPTALKILRQAAARMDGFNFETMIFPDFVEVYGLASWDDSIAALEQFTQQSSGESAVRPFILHDQTRMMAQMAAWAVHENQHVRRLASEGCRPRLPWAMALPAFKADPSPILPILEQLKTDESEYVRRSVANNLNDISKDNPQVVIEVLRRWCESDTPAMQAMIKHALRTLVKAGHPDALALMGVRDAAGIVVKNLRLAANRVRIGENLPFLFEVVSENAESQKLIIDYAVHLLRANGSHTPKVFKLAQKQIAPGESLSIKKTHSFKPVTTRVYYPGEHAIEIQINGSVLARETFLLEG